VSLNPILMETAEANWLPVVRNSMSSNFDTTCLNMTIFLKRVRIVLTTNGRRELTPIF